MRAPGACELTDEPVNSDTPDPWGGARWVRDGVLVHHLYPLRGRQHDLSPYCWCNPTHEASVNELGGRWEDYTHHRTQ